MIIAGFFFVIILHITDRGCLPEEKRRGNAARICIDLMELRYFATFAFNA
jgi:hypothetical protein